MECGDEVVKKGGEAGMVWGFRHHCFPVFETYFGCGWGSDSLKVREPMGVLSANCKKWGQWRPVHRTEAGRQIE